MVTRTAEVTRLSFVRVNLAWLGLFLWVWAMSVAWLGILFVALLAYTVKAMTGFGSAIVLISLGALFFPAKSLIPVVALLDLVACLMLMRQDWQRGAASYWGPASASMVVGSVLGAVLLKLLAPSTFEILLGGGIMLLGGWLFFNRKQGANLLEQIPAKPTAVDLGVTGLAGFTGGLFGISGPLIVWHFGRKFSKQAFRRVVVSIFFFASIACIISYTALGIITAQTLLLALACLPMMFLGLKVGQRLFMLIPEHRFGQIIGSILMLVAAKLLFA